MAYAIMENLATLAALLVPQSLLVRRIKGRIARAVYACSSSDVYLYKSGRSALRGLMGGLRLANPRRGIAFVPDYVCNVVPQACRAAGFEVREYRTDHRYMPDWTKLCAEVRKTEYPVVVLCSLFGSVPLTCPEVDYLKKASADLFIVADECQNLVNDSPARPSLNLAIVFSFNDKTCPGIMGGGVVCIQSSGVKPVYKTASISRQLLCAVALFRLWMMKSLAAIRRTLRIIFCKPAGYAVPNKPDISRCNTPHYDLFPEAIYKLSAARAFTSLRHLGRYRRYRRENAEGIARWVGDPGHDAVPATAPPFLPIPASFALREYIPVRLKAPYGQSEGDATASKRQPAFMINEPSIRYQARKAAVVQLTSRHAITDNRLLHCMARTADSYGYQSSIMGPAEKADSYGKISLIAYPKTNTSQKGRALTVPINLLIGAIRTSDTAFQIHDPDMLPIGILLRVLRRKVIYDVHDDYEASFWDRLQGRRWLRIWFPSFWWWFERNAARLFDGVIVADRHLAKKFERCTPVVLGNYPRIEFTPPADSSKESTFNLIYVGGVTEERGLGKALKALQMIPNPELRLHIIGTGRDENLMARLRAEPRVVLHGRVEWTKLHQHYTKAHVGLALYQPLEGFMYYPGENAVKIIEYMAAGIPTICSNFPGLKAFVEDQGCGLAVQPDDPNAIASEIRKLMDDSKLRIRLGAKGRELFETEYNWEKHEHQLVELYERVCGQWAVGL